MDTEYLIMIIVCVVVTLPIAYSLNKRFKTENPDKLGYMWGFIQGTAPIVMSAILSVLFIVVHYNQMYTSETVTIMMGVAFLRAAVAFGVIKRYRWIFIIHTILSLNIFLWIINGLYIKNRWKEMKYERVVKIEVLET